MMELAGIGNAVVAIKSQIPHTDPERRVDECGVGFWQG
jgi:hypothetical protein